MTEGQTPARPRLKRFVRIGAIAAALGTAAIVILLAGLRFYFSDARIRQMLLDAAAQTLGKAGALQIGSLKLRIFSGLEIKDLKLCDPVKPEPPIFQADSLRLLYRVAPLLRGRIVLEDISIQKPVLFLESRGGRWNYEAILPPQAAPSPAAPLSAAKPFSLLASVLVRHLAVKDLSARIRVEDAWEAALAGAELTAEASLTGPQAELQCQEEIRIPQIRFTIPQQASLEFSLTEKAEFRLNLSTGDLAFLTEEMHVPGLLDQTLTGRAEGFGQKSLEIEKIAVSVDLQELSRCLAKFVEPHLGTWTMQGRVDLSARLAGALPSSPNGTGQLRASAHLKMDLQSLEASRWDGRLEGCIADWDGSFDLSFPQGQPKNINLKGRVALEQAEAFGQALPGPSQAEICVALDDLDSGHLRVEKGHLQITGLAEADGNGEVSQWGQEEFRGRLQLLELHLAPLSRLGLGRILFGDASITAGGRMAALVEVEGTMPTPQQIGNWQVPVQVALKTQVENFKASGDGFEFGLDKIGLDFLKTRENQFRILLEVPAGQIHGYNSPESGGLGKFLWGDASRLPHFKASAAPSLRIHGEGRVPTPEELKSLTLPFSLDATLGLGLNASVAGLHSDIPEAQARLGKLQARLTVSAPENPPAARKLSVEVTGSDFEVTLPSIKAGGSARLLLQDVGLSIPFEILLPGGQVESAAEGLTYHLDKFLTGHATFKADPFGDGVVELNHHLDLDWGGCRELLEAFSPVFLGTSVSAQGRLSLDTTLRNWRLWGAAGPGEPANARIDLTLDLASAAYGADREMQTRQPLHLRVAADASWQPEKDKLHAQGDAEIRAEGLLLRGPVSGQCDKFNCKFDFAGDHVLTHTLPSLQAKGKIDCSGLNLLDQLSVESGQLKFDLSSQDEQPDLYRLGFFLNLAGARYQAPGLKAGPLDALIQSEKTEMDLARGRLETKLAARSPTMGDDFQLRLDASAQDWGQTFEAHLEADRFRLEKFVPWLSDYLFGPGSPAGRILLAASGPAQIRADARGRLPDDQQLQSLKVPINLEARVDLADATLAYTEEAPVAPPAGGTGKQGEDAAPAMASLTMELSHLNATVVVEHPASEGKLRIRINEFQDARFRYDDSALGEILLPLSTAAPIAINIEDLVTGMTTIGNFPFSSADYFTGSFHGGLQLYDLVGMDLNANIQASMANFPALLQQQKLGPLSEAAKALSLEGSADLSLRITSVPNPQGGLADLMVQMRIQPKLDSMALEQALEAGPVTADLLLETSYLTERGETGKVSLSGPVTMEKPLLAGGSLSAESVPISFNLELKEKTLDELKAEFNLLAKALALEQSPLRLPAGDLSLNLSPAWLNLTTGDLHLKGHVAVGDWLALKPIELSAGNWGEKLGVNLGEVTLDAHALIQVAASASEAFPQDITVNTQGPLKATFSAAVDTLSEQDFSTHHLAAFLKAILLPELRQMLTGLQVSLELPASSFGSESAGLAAEGLALGAAAGLDHDNLTLSGNASVSTLWITTASGSTSVNPAADFRLEVRAFDQVDGVGHFHLPAWGVTSELKIFLGGLASLHQGQEFVMDPSSLASLLRGKVSGRFECNLPKPRELVRDLLAQGTIRMRGEAGFKPGQQLQLSGDLEILPTSVRYGTELEISGLRGKIPLIKTYRVHVVSPEEASRGDAPAGPSNILFEPRPGDRPAASAEPADAYAFAGQLLPYARAQDQVELDAVLFRGRPVIQNLSMAVRFVEGMLLVEPLRLTLLNGDVNGRIAVRTGGERQELEIWTEFAGIGSSPRSDAGGSVSKEAGGINGNLRLLIALEAAEGSRRGGISDVSGSFHLTRMDRQTLLNLLKVVDPQESNAEINGIRQVLALGSPKVVHLEIRHGTLSGKVVVDLPPPLGSQSLALPDVPLRKLARTKTAEATLSALEVVQDFLAKLAAQTLEFSPDGSVRFR